MSSARSEHLTLGYLPTPAVSLPRSGSSTANTSPTEPSSGNALRSPFGLSGGLNSAGKMASSARSGAGSPSHELGSASRLFSKRYDETPRLKHILTFFAEHEKSKPKKVCPSFGDLQPAAIPPPSAKTYPNHQLMASPTSHTSPHPRVCPPQDEHELVPSHLASLQAE
jgi:hypothetical protein